MESAIIVFRLLAVSQIILFLGMMAMSSNPVRVRLVGCLLMLGIASYLVAPLCCQVSLLGLAPFIWLPASITPSLLLLFAWVLCCDDESSFPLWFVGFMTISIGISIVAHLSYFQQPHIASIAGPISSVAQIAKIVTVGLAIVVLWRGRDHDLVELRVRFRNMLVLVISITALSITVVEFVTAMEVPMFLELAGMVMIFVSALCSNLYFIRLNPAVKLVGEATTPMDHSDDSVIQTLLQRMRDERLYADHDLRVASLADILSVPEYQLRKRINQKLGYRNFNQFVNRYRIEEAGVRLIDDMKSPVLTIALDVGFRSISSFNTAFQTQFGVSPTRYRAEYQLKQ